MLRKFLLAAIPVLGADEQAPPGPALLVIRLPAAATLTIDSAATRQTGPEPRTFMTPSLPAGKTFSYDLKATWEEGGKTKTASRQDGAGLRRQRRTVIEPGRAEPGEDHAGEIDTHLFVYLFWSGHRVEAGADGARLAAGAADWNEDQQIKVSSRWTSPPNPKEGKRLPNTAIRWFTSRQTSPTKGRYDFSRAPTG